MYAYTHGHICYVTLLITNSLECLLAPRNELWSQSANLSTNWSTIQPNYRSQPTNQPTINHDFAWQWNVQEKQLHIIIFFPTCEFDCGKQLNRYKYSVQIEIDYTNWKQPYTVAPMANEDVAPVAKACQMINGSTRHVLCPERTPTRLNNIARIALRYSTSDPTRT